MSEETMIQVPLFKLFKNQRGNSLYTRQYCNKHKGSFPVYTGTTIGTFASIDTYEYDFEQLTYTTDGENSGTLELLSGKYNVGGHRAILIPLSDFVYLEYFKYLLEPLFKQHTKRGNVPSTTWTTIKSIKCNVPIDERGQYDLYKQKEIASSYKRLEKSKQLLQEQSGYLSTCILDISLDDIEIEYEEIAINELFDLTQSSNSSSFTKTFIKNHPGTIPVYGATKRSDEVSYGYIDDNVFITSKNKRTQVKYFENCLTFNIDGSAGYVFYRKGRFSLSEKVRPLIVKEEYKKYVDLNYLQYITQNLFRSITKGRVGHDGQNEFSKLNITMIKDKKIKIPISSDGTFDIDMQRNIAKKFEKLYEIRRSITEQIELLINTEIRV